jgi:outer membrane protein
MKIDDLINYGLCNNPEISSAWSKVLADQANLGSKYSGYLPNISLMTGYANINAPIFNQSGWKNTNVVMINYLLYDFGKRENEIDQFRELLNASGYQYLNKVQNVIYDITRQYYEYLSISETLRAREKSEELAKTILDYTNIKRKVGSARKLDVLQAESVYIKAKMLKSDVEKRLESAKRILLLNIGIENGNNIDIFSSELTPEKDDAKNLDQLINAAKENNNRIKESKVLLLAKEYELKSKNKEHYPSLSAFGILNRNGMIYGLPGIGSFNFFGLSLSVPIFSGFKTSYGIDAMQYGYDLQKSQTASVQKDVLANIMNGYNNLSVAKDNIETTRSVLDINIESEKIVRDGYRMGINSMIDVMNAQSNLAQAMEENINAKYQYYISRAYLFSTIGETDIKY